MHDTSFHQWLPTAFGALHDVPFHVLSCPAEFTSAQKVAEAQDTVDVPPTLTVGSIVTGLPHPVPFQIHASFAPTDMQNDPPAQDTEVPSPLSAGAGCAGSIVVGTDHVEAAVLGPTDCACTGAAPAAAADATGVPPTNWARTPRTSTNPASSPIACRRP